MASKSLVVALVDDDIDCLDLSRGIVEAGGHRAVCYSDCESAVAGMMDDVPDVIVTDLMMTSLDSGFNLARRLKTISGLADVPVIILTAAGSRRGYDFRPTNEADLAAMEVDAFFEKPVVAKRLLAKISELVANRKGAGQ